MKHKIILLDFLLICAVFALAALLLIVNENQQQMKQLKVERDIYASRAENWQAETAQIQAEIEGMKFDYESLKAARNAISDGLTASYAGEFLCTSYDLNCDKCQTGGITYSGEKAIAGYTVAADLSTFPIGTWLYIEDIGIRRVMDTGGGVAKNQLDVVVSGNHADALKWTGYGYHRVWVLEMSENG